MNALIDRLEDEGRRWGFELQTKSTYNTYSHRFRANDEWYMSFIVNKKWLLFYFRKPLLKAVSNFDQLIRKSGLPFDKNKAGEYQLRITNDRLCTDVIRFIDADLIARLALKAPRQNRTGMPKTTRRRKSTLAPDAHFAEESDIEGLMTEVVRFHRKRSRKMRDRAFQKAKGICCVCGRDYSKLLGGHGVRVLQVHHREQLAARDAPSVTTVSDLAVVCANCHLLLHLDSDKALSVDVLREMLRKDGYLPLA